MEQVMTPSHLYKWAVLKDPLSLLEYCTFEDHSKETMMLEERFREAQTLMGFKKISFHSCLQTPI
jgi:hypothetical protein